MGIILTTATLTMESGLPEDAAVWSFVTSSFSQPAPGNTVEWTSPINSFINALAPGLSSRVSNAPLAVKYDLYSLAGHLDGSPHGSPIATDAGTILTPTAADAFPNEVALVLTLRGLGWEGQPVEAPDGSDPGVEPDRLRARRTGRMYLGPLSTDAVNPDGSRPSTTHITRVLDAGAQLRSTWQGISNIEWCVWSRKNAAVYPISHLQVDDAWDIQRRRGLAPTSRTTRAVV